MKLLHQVVVICLVSLLGFISTTTSKTTFKPKEWQITSAPIPRNKELSFLESNKQDETTEKWHIACLASLRNSYLKTLTGWKTENNFEQKKAKCLVEIQTLIEANTLQNLSNKDLINRKLLDYFNKIQASTVENFDWKDLYNEHILPLELAYLDNSKDTSKKTLFEENFLNQGAFSQIKYDSTKVNLGKLLFYETALSGNFKRSCSSCHRPQKAFCDNRQTSLGFELGTNLTKNAPTLINAIYNNSFFHDGRAKDIHAVIEGVVTHPDEFKNDFPTIIQRLESSDEYKVKFEKVYHQKGIKKEQIQGALVAFIGSLSSQKSVFDEWIRGNNKDINLNKGFNAFMSNCASCHFPPTFSGILPPFYNKNDTYNSVKTPTLRNIALTQPYMHDGSEMELSGVLKKHYGSQLSASQQAEIIVFLDALTDTKIDITLPKTLPTMTAFANRKIGGFY